MLESKWVTEWPLRLTENENKGCLTSDPLGAAQKSIYGKFLNAGRISEGSGWD
jgi:hypothetical protein